MPKSSFCEWVIHLNAYYHSLFAKNTKLLLGLLKEDGRFEDIATICEKYNCYYSYDEDVHVMLLEAYAKTSRIQKATSHYQYIEEMFFEEFGVGLTEETVKFYRELTKSAHNVEYDIKNIQTDLVEAVSARGAFFCDYDIFKNIYRLQSRMLQRNGASVYFALFTIFRICAAIVADAEPDTTPQISPTTSLQILDTLLALRSRYKDSFAPFSLWAAMEWNGLGSAAVVATPITSNTMPKPINATKIKTATTTPAPSSIDSDARLSTADRATAIKKAVTAQRYGADEPLFFCCVFFKGLPPKGGNSKLHLNKLSRRQQKR